MKKLFRYLEYRFCVPEFAGGMLIMLSVFFFAAATNTLSGWLYVISGVSFALLLIAGILPRRVLKDIEITRSPIEPVSAGEEIAIELVITNKDKADKSLIQVYDFVPERLEQDSSLDSHPEKVVEELASAQNLRWVYTLNTQYRGIFWFGRVDLVTASPFGLFRSRRSLIPNQANNEINNQTENLIAQKAIVYPKVLTLNQCPLIDQMGAEETPKTYSQRYVNANANEGLTKALRPYRWGDPTRLIHWRSSAKFGELKIRELEITLSGQDLVIALDTSSGWEPYQFEEAVVAAASLYFYAQGLNLNVKLWTNLGGTVQGQQIVLETLAGVNPNPDDLSSLSFQGLNTKLPDIPAVWLTHRQDSLASLSSTSRWILWSEQLQDLTDSSGLLIKSGDHVPEEDKNTTNEFSNLRSQLQRQLISSNR